ncbi:MAG: P-loop NTPase [Clostridia bacterium]|nr:P-loop NTPase [Clostridia bacterium]MDD4048220.1 P-loop NTPase [Clostridia bacterium]
MKELIIISGKGGTGKTSIVASLANIFDNKVLADCDVDAADLHLILNPDFKIKKEFWSGKTAYIYKDKCTQCSKCQELCRFDAISANFAIDKIACEGCGVCAYFCPQDAIDMRENLAGHVFLSNTVHGSMVHAKLGAGEDNSGKLVTEVRKHAKQKAEENNIPLILVDGPPGIGCPVIASITGADNILIVTEPTLSSLHDLERVVNLANYFHIKPFVCINKIDINPSKVSEIVEKCAELEIEIIGKIPYDEDITKAQVKKQSIVEFNQESQAAKEIISMANELKRRLNI